ncbi:MAG: TIGR04454 family lipoprotein [Nannocystaceae bacterium]
MRKTSATLLVLGLCASFTLPACGSKPTKEECEKHADHYAELMGKGQEGPQAEIAKSVAADMRPELIRECQEERSKKEIECMMKADSMEALEACLGGKK